MLQTLSIFILPAAAIVAAMIDVASYKIPNWLTALTAALFFPMAALTGMPLVEFGWHLLAGFVLFFAGYGLFVLRLFGGGDAKLMAAIGLWFGPSSSFEFLLMTAIAGGGLALAVAIWSFITMFWELQGSLSASTIGQKMKNMNFSLPYGFALCVGAILAFPHTWWMTVN